MKPLAGKHIVITRPAGQAAPFIGKIEEAGGTAYAVPLIAFKRTSNQKDDTIIKNLSTYDWIVLTSKNGVDFFMEKAGIHLLNIPAKFAAIGEKTAKAIESYGFSVSYIPNRFSADQLVKEIQQELFLPKKALIPKGNLARSIISNAIRQKGKKADDWIVYETFFPEEEKKKLRHFIKEKQMDMYTFTSPSAVQHFMKVVREENQALPDAHYACIGPITKKEAAKHGINVSVCPAEYTIDALVREIKYFYKE